jgi:hypothetical protein
MPSTSVASRYQHMGLEGVVRLTLFLQVHAAFCDHDWHVAVDVAFSVLVEQRYRNVRVWYALDKGYAEYAWKCSLCVQPIWSVNACDRWWWGLEALLARPSALSGTPGALRTLHADARTPMPETTLGEAVPFSSSFFAGFLLNCLHHEVKSRFAEAGSGVCVCMAAGWGSPLRTRGVCM